MRPHLGAELWDEFVEHANRHYKAGWLRAFAPASGVLRCVGTLDGAPCPHAAAVDLRAGATRRPAVLFEHKQMHPAISRVCEGVFYTRFTLFMLFMQ